ncbi:hypothetical protein ACSFA0_24575 [Variovorax sp. LT1P1]|uniref:hypothetical protein n=1 Tax=Variovorax sp. LT1P1 TaxID=3443730 RepID=UPI003F44F89C
MTSHFLKDVAAERLPKMSYRPAEIRAIRELSRAGLIIARFADRDGYGEIPYAQVIAITEKGHRERLEVDIRRPATEAA